MSWGWAILLIAVCAGIAGCALGGFILWIVDLAQAGTDDRDNPWSLR